jgi:hypothetical protein
MMSHELARLLLSRRNNDIRFTVTVDADPTGLEDPEEGLQVELADAEAERRGEPAPELVEYDPEQDVLVIRLGTIYLGEEPELPLGLCADREDHRPHRVTEGSLAPFWCTAEQSQRLPHAAELRRS